jgi:L,D-transpeptidase YcbB
MPKQTTTASVLRVSALLVCLYGFAPIHAAKAWPEYPADVPSDVRKAGLPQSPDAPSLPDASEEAAFQPLKLDVPFKLNLLLPDDIPLADELIAHPQPALLEEVLPAVEQAGLPPRKAGGEGKPVGQKPSLPHPAASTPVMIDLDDAGIRAALEPMRIALRLSPAKVEGIVAAYASHNREAFWISRSGDHIRPLPGVEGVLATLASAGQDGLDERRLRHALPAIPGDVIAPDKAAAFDLAMSLAAYLYAHDARGGRLEPSRLSPLLTPVLHLPDAEALLIRLAGQPAEKVAAILRGYQPRHPGYVALRAQLASLHARADYAHGKDVQVASTQTGIPALRQDDLIADILVNMERWRWLPPDLGENHIFVNVPDYQLSVVSSGAITHQTRVIVGRAETPTPVFSDVMEHLIINPSWHVPPSILRKEFLPNLAKDPNYAARKGFEVVRNGNSISVRQPPGERNALGQIKFIFPNQHSVYLHDTPGRHLFAQESRAFSHGCVRVDAPFLLAERILAEQGGERADGLRAMVGKGERMIRINEPWFVHLAYFTLSVDAHGGIIRRKDIYGHDVRMRSALLQGSSAAMARAP